MSEPSVFNAKERAERKQRSRDADAQALASGTKTPADLLRENAVIKVPISRVSFRDIPVPR